MLKIYWYPLIGDYVFRYFDDDVCISTWTVFLYDESMELVAEVED